MQIDPARFATDALHREAQARAADRAEADRIALHKAQEQANQAATRHAERMNQWRNDALDDLGSRLGW
jgi:hypothetical protein